MSQAASEGPLISEYASDADMLELIEMFVAELPERVTALNDAMAAGDLARVGGLAHQLKGAGGGYGYPTITDSAFTLETMAKAGTDDLDAVRRNIDELVSLCNRASAAV